MGTLCSKINNYNDYTRYYSNTCYKCGDIYKLSHGGFSLRTSCRYHLHNDKKCIHCDINLEKLGCRNCYHCFSEK